MKVELSADSIEGGSKGTIHLQLTLMKLNYPKPLTLNPNNLNSQIVNEGMEEKMEAFIMGYMGS